MDYKKAQTKNVKVFGIIVLLFLFLAFVVAAPYFSAITEPTGQVNNNSIVISYNITQDDSLNPNNVLFNWNGTNYTVYNNSGVVLEYNFNNYSSLGEDDNTVIDNSGNDNNGAVTNAIWSSANNGGFVFDGSGDKIENTSTNFQLYNGTNNWSFSIEFNIDACGSEEGIIGFGNSTRYLRVYCNINDMFIYYQNETGSQKYRYFDSVSTDVIQHWTFVYNGTGIERYEDGELQGITTTTGGNAISPLSGTGVYVGVNPTGSGYFEGSIYKAKVWNRTLTPLEVSDLYQATVSKYDSDTLILWANQTLDNSGLNSTNPTRDYTYYICSSNSTDGENCTSTKTVSAIISKYEIYANFTNEIATINPYFYGTNDQYLQLGNNTNAFLDVDCDGSSNTPSNLSWHRNLFEDSGMNHIRIWNYDINNIALSEGVYDETQIQYLMNEAEYANDMGYAITYVRYGTATWNANTSSDCSQSSSLYAGDWASCAPLNVTKTSEIDRYILANISSVATDVPINYIPYNEPWHSGFFLNDLNQDNETKAIEFAKIYNSSYDYMKANLPKILVGWSMFTSLQSDVLSDRMMSNFSNKMDFVGLHYYDGTSYFKNPGWNIDDTVNDLLADCTTFGANCSKIIFDEWDIDIKWSLPDANYSMEVAYFYQYLLNNIPNRTQSMKFKWSARHGYGCDVGETEFPKNFPMVNEVNNSVTLDYNVTKNFAAYHSSGSKIYNSTSSLTAVKTLSSKKDNKHYITVMNTDTEARNITVDTGGTLTKLFNMQTGEEFSSDTGVFTVGVMDSYEILYLGYQGIDGGLVSQINLDENSGTTAYDTSGNSNDGTITGATWATDGFFNTLTAITDYTIDTTTGLFTIVNNDYQWAWMNVSYSYNSRTTNQNIATARLIVIFTALAILAFVFILIKPFIDQIKGG